MKIVFSKDAIKSLQEITDFFELSLDSERIKTIQDRFEEI